MSHEPSSKGEDLTGHLTPDSSAILLDQLAHFRWNESGILRLDMKTATGDSCRKTGFLLPLDPREGSVSDQFGLMILPASSAPSDRDYQELANSLPQIIFETDAAGTLLFANHQAFESYGYTREEFDRGLNMFDMVAPEQLEMAHRNFNSVLEGHTGGGDYLARRKDGSMFPIAIYSSPIIRDGQAAGLRGIIVDLTERKATETRLLEAEDRYRALFENTPDSQYLIRVEDGPRFVVESVNPSFERISGVPCSQMTGKSLDESLPPHLYDEVLKNYVRCLETGLPQDYEEIVDLPNGRIHYRTRLIPLHNPEGRVYRIAGISQDITREEATRQALRQAQKLECLGLLAGGIAHDFNNLLTALLGNLGLARLEITPGSAALTYLDISEQTTYRAADLVRQLLAYSGGGYFVVQPLDLNLLIRDISELLRAAHSSRVTLDLRLAPALPLIEADRTQVQQVVMNLVANASDAIGDQEGVIRISTGTTCLASSLHNFLFPAEGLPPGPYVWLEVEDTGCGIPSAFREKIFDPFFTTKGTGRGLGLSATLGILRAHSAGACLSSEPGAGTVFTLFFPSSERLSAPKPKLPAEQRPIFSGTVLLADDDPAILTVIGRTLERMGLSVLRAADGEEAVNLFRQHTGDVHLALLDLAMPRLNGGEVFRILHRECPTMPVLLSSGFDANTILPSLLEDGLSGFLQKPYRLEELEKLLSGLLRPSSSGTTSS